MSDDTFDLYLVEDPTVIHGDNADHTLVGYLSDLLAYYADDFRVTLPVTTADDFIHKVIEQSRNRKKKIKTLVIASHGGPSHFYLGKDMVDFQVRPDNIPKLAQIAPYLTKDAKVYIIACFTGQDQKLLKAVSKMLGGVSVQGYTKHYITTDYIFWKTLREEAGGHEVACFASRCSVGPPQMDTERPMTDDPAVKRWMDRF